MYTVYIIYSPSLDRYYIGFTQDITDRLRRHNSKSKGFTNRANDWIIVHVESFNQKNEAMRREKEIKGWKSKKLIEKLIHEAGSEHLPYKQRVTGSNPVASNTERKASRN